MEIYLQQQRNITYIKYLQGNPTIEKDLRRAQATTAKACVLLTNKNVSNSISVDHKNILTGKIKNFKLKASLLKNTCIIKQTGKIFAYACS